MFEEIPKVDFTVKDENGDVIFRDSIVYATMAELRADSHTEREAKFQQRYDDYLAFLASPPTVPEGE